MADEERPLLWRKTSEIHASIAWFASAGWMLWVSDYSGLQGLSFGLLSIALWFAVLRMTEAIDLLKRKYALLGKGVKVVHPNYVIKKMKKHPDKLWLGEGFDWTYEEAQLVYELKRKKIKEIVPRILQKFKRKWPVKGVGYIHGSNTDEKDIYIGYDQLAGHCFIPSTTGSLKTRTLTLIALQAILRDPKQCVIVVDPKGDPELLNLIRWACKAASREDDFCYLHPAFPKKSVRIDLMKNWSTTTEGASRVAEMMGGDQSSAPFKAYGWQVINNTIQGMLGVGERPQLTNLRRYIEGGPDLLIQRLIKKYIAHLGYDPEIEIEKYMKKAQKARGRKETTPKETIAAVFYYKSELQDTRPLAAIDGLLTMYEHDAAHFSKMIATLQPIMAMLTSDELESLLSPDYNDTTDPREILDNARIIRTGRVLYLGLHSMPDATVSSAIGSLFLADLVAVLGERNVRGENTPGVTLLLDEANEIVNPPLVSLLNKGRSAGLMVYFFTQTIQDFIAKYKEEAPAMQLLGNANNMIFGRSLETKTVQYIMEKAGETVIKKKMDQYGVNPVSDNNILKFHANYGTRTSEEKEPILNPDEIKAIPDMEGFAILADGGIKKLRIPVVQVEKAA